MNKFTELMISNINNYVNIKQIIKSLIILILINISVKGLIFNIKTKFNLNLAKNKVKNVCLCSPAKGENKYIREFVSYYINFGVDKIFIYDNNNIDGEKIEDIVLDYINSGIVEVVDFRGKEKAQIKIMNHCYIRNFEKYDWLFFFDIDEFLFLRNYRNVKAYLSNDNLTNCIRIHFNWVFFTDNNLLSYDNRSLFDRFTEKEPKVRLNLSRIAGIKTIIRGHIKNITEVECQHRISFKFPSCDGYGVITELKGIETPNGDYENYYIKHFYCKSTEEFISKVMKGDIFFGKNADKINMDKIKKYFEYNKITLEKINLIEKYTKYNLSELKSKIKN